MQWVGVSISFRLDLNLYCLPDPGEVSNLFNVRRCEFLAATFRCLRNYTVPVIYDAMTGQTTTKDTLHLFIETFQS